jgi:hypothetical protein
VTTIVVIGLLLAWRNVRAGRGDRIGALRMAGFIFLASLIADLLIADHQPSGVHEVAVLQRAIADALLWAAILYVLYLALEPFVRRRWPATLIASTRLLSGNVRDPMVGRDLLIGIVTGLTHIGIIAGTLWIMDRTSGIPYPPEGGGLAALAGTRFAIGHVVSAIAAGATYGFVYIVILVSFMLVLRRRILAAAGLALVMMLGYYMAIGRIMPSTVLITLMVVFITARYGLLAIAASQGTFFATFHYPYYGAGGWQATNLIPLLAILAFATWAFRNSLGGQSPFSASLLDE